MATKDPEHYELGAALKLSMHGFPGIIASGLIGNISGSVLMVYGWLNSNIAMFSGKESLTGWFWFGFIVWIASALLILAGLYMLLDGLRTHFLIARVAARREEAVSSAAGGVEGREHGWK